MLFPDQQKLNLILDLITYILQAVLRKKLDH